MIWLKQIFLLVSCILVSLQGEVLDSDVDTQLTSSILKFLEERNYGSYRAATILQKTVMDDKLEVTFQVKRTCDYQCVEDTLKCESIFIKSEGEPLWRLAGAICLPIEPEYVQQKNIIPAYVGKPVTDQEKMVEEPKMVPLTVEEPKIVRDFVEEPKIERDFVEEPKVVHDFVQEPKVVNDFVGDPKIVRDFVEEPKIEEPKIEEPKVVDEFVGDPKIVRDFIEEPKVVPHTVDVVTPKNNAEEPHLKHIEISDESPKKTVPCLGCPMDINPNAYGVTDLINTALRHIESERIQKHTALKVLRVQQQVVSGIKYTLLVEVAPTLCPKTIDAPSCPIDQSQDSFICEVQFWEKSWERFTQVIKNNCTNTQEYVYNTGFYTTTKIPEREVDFGDLESQILFDYEIEQPRTNFHEPDWVNANHQIYTPIGYGPEVILQKRRVRDIPEENEDEHHVFKRYSRDSDSDSSSSSSSESDESNNKKRHHDNSDDDDNKSSKNNHNHKHNHGKSDSCEHHHKNKYNHRDSRENDDHRDKHHSDDSNKSSKSSESSDSSESDDHKKKHKHYNDVRRKRSVEPEDDPKLLDDLAWIASQTLDYDNYVLVGSSKVRLNELHYKLQLLLEKDRTVIECSVFMTVNEGSIYDSTIDKYHCNTDEVWKHKATQASRSKTLGGLVPISTDDPQLKLYLRDGLTNLDKTSPHTNKYKILKIIEATKQTVSGSLYHIKAHVTLSDCEKEKDTDPATCGVLKDAPVKECNFKIWDQPWLPQGRQTNVTCDNDEEVKNFRQKHENLTGGINSIPKDDSQVKLYLKEGLNMMDQASTNTNKYKVLEILNASSQVVNGAIYHIKARITVSDCEKKSKVNRENCGILKDALVQVCDFKIWVEPQKTNAKEINVTCKWDLAYHHRQRRSLGMPGGINPISTDNPQVKGYLKDALTHLDKSSSHDNKLKILDVVEASTQVVSGYLYRIKAHVTVSDCAKGKDTDPATCGVLKDAPVKECNFKIWDQPWLPQGRQTNITCGEEQHSFRLRRSVNIPAGGINSIPKDDSQVKLYLKKALDNMDETSINANKYKVLEILDASSQVVNGVIYHIKARIAVSDCKKQSKVNRENCGILKDALVQLCDFKIWAAPRITNATEIEVTCKRDLADHHRKRRSLGAKGGINPISPDNPKVKGYLKDALTHLDKSSSHDNKLKVLDVIEASRQVVSGSLYRIRAHVTVSDCAKGKDTDPATCGVLKDAPVKECHFTIWDQPWLPQGRQTNITCDEEQHSFRLRRSVNIPAHEDAVKLFFKHFQYKYSKTYTTKAEYKHRLSVFKNNLNMIDLLNKYEQGTARYGINQFADLTQKEFSSLHGLRMDLQSENDVPFSEAEIPEMDLPTSFDWRDKKAVTEVKDQGSCGSCWAFSTTGNIEGQYAIKYKNLTSLSEQELVDCDKLDDGCNGGLMDNAYRAIEKLGGLESEREYPYDAKDEKCHFNTSEVVAQISSAVNISHNETDMAKWLTKNGPIAIAINANAMQFYMGGVSHPYKIFCNPKSLDHGVLIVGYGVHTSTIRKKVLPYWIVKNSWGTSWGEQGYYRVYRGDGTCGLNQTPSSAVIL